MLSTDLILDLELLEAVLLVPEYQEQLKLNNYPLDALTKKVLYHIRQPESSLIILYCNHNETIYS